MNTRRMLVGTDKNIWKSSKSPQNNFKKLFKKKALKFVISKTL
jgi:hypothetical protein